MTIKKNTGLGDLFTRKGTGFLTTISPDSSSYYINGEDCEVSYKNDACIFKFTLDELEELIERMGGENNQDFSLPIIQEYYFNKKEEDYTVITNGIYFLEIEGKYAISTAYLRKENEVLAGTRKQWENLEALLLTCRTLYGGNNE